MVLHLWFFRAKLTLFQFHVITINSIFQASITHLLIDVKCCPVSFHTTLSICQSLLLSCAENEITQTCQHNDAISELLMEQSQCCLVKYEWYWILALGQLLVSLGVGRPLLFSSFCVLANFWIKASHLKRCLLFNVAK